MGNYRHPHPPLKYKSDRAVSLSTPSLIIFNIAPFSTFPESKQYIHLLLSLTGVCDPPFAYPCFLNALISSLRMKSRRIWKPLRQSRAEVSGFDHTNLTALSCRCSYRPARPPAAADVGRAPWTQQRFCLAFRKATQT